MNQARIFAGFGYVAGVAVGIAISASYFKKRYRTIADEEIESVKEIYNRKPDPEEFKRQMKALDEEIRQEREAEEAAKLSQTNFSAYKNILNPYQDKDALIERSDADEPVKPKPIVQEESKSHWITEEEFLEDCKDYDKITLLYYYESDTYVDDSGELVTMADELLSFPNDTHSRFRGPGDTPPTALYFRNVTVEADFEILKQMDASPFE